MSPTQPLQKADFTSSGNFIRKPNSPSKEIFAFLLDFHVLYSSNPAMHTLCFFFSFPTQGAIKITSQTFTASGTSKPPVQHLFYFYSPFSTFPSLLAFSLLCKRKGMEENTQLTKQKRGGRKSVLASGFCSEGARSPARSHNPITRGW